MEAPCPENNGEANLTGSVMVMLVVFSFSGCMFWEGTDPKEDVEDTLYPSIWERHTLDWKTDGSYSMSLEVGPYSAMGFKKPELLLTPQGFGNQGRSPPRYIFHIGCPTTPSRGKRYPS